MNSKIVYALFTCCGAGLIQCLLGHLFNMNYVYIRYHNFSDLKRLAGLRGVVAGRHVYMYSATHDFLGLNQDVC